MTFPTYEEWGEKVAEQVIDIYLINGRTIREWIEILSDELTILDDLRAEIMQIYEAEKDIDIRWATGLKHSIKIIDKYRNEVGEE